MQADMPTGEQPEEVSADVSQDAKNLGILIWVGTLFFWFIPGLVFFLLKKDAYSESQAKEALNWSITVLLAYIVSTILMLVAIGFLLMPLLGLCHLVFCIMGAAKTAKGGDFKVPFALRLLK